MRTLLCLSFSLLLSSSIQAQEKPNVLFIAVDDLRPELATYGTKLKTPNFDQLAASGMRFDRAYCQQAVCGASRLSIMGGLYPSLSKEQSYHVDKWRDRHPDLITMNQHFGANGYHTIGLGKIYHGSSGPGIDPENWNEWIKVSQPEYATEESNAILREFSKAKKEKGSVHGPHKGPTTEMADVDDSTYTDGLRAKKAALKLKELAKKNQPFFFAIGFSKPHLPFVAPKKYWDLYQREDFKMPDNKEIPPGYPPYAANLPAYEMRKYSDYEGEMPSDFSDEMNQRLLHGYAACVSYVDANLGRVLRMLKETGLDKNTIVVLWGDHGWKLGDHSSWCKHTNFECDTRVPLILRDPRKEAGQSTNRLVELIDLYPTLCELTGIATPAHCQGRSFTKLLDDPEAGHRNSAYSSYPANKDLGHSIRFGDYRYTEWHSPDGSKTGQRVLTNLRQDPGEVTNVADKAKHAEALEKGIQLLDHRVVNAMKAKTTTRTAPAKAKIIDKTPLKEAVAGRFRIGVGTDRGIRTRPEDAALMKRHFDIITPENCMKTKKLQPKEGEFDFTQADKFVDFAEENGIDMVGHCLIWARPGTTPPWFFLDGEKPVSKELLLQRLKTHIHTVAGRYKGRLAMWDVVNEALADHDDEYLRDNEWNNILGEDFLVKAFQYAREADPDALLVYNDYRCDHPGKLKKIIRLIKSVKEKGGPIDALGLQAHYEYGMIPYEGIESALVEMRKLGVKVVFSELDMDVVTRAKWYWDDGKFREELQSSDPYPNCPDDVLAAQAEQYAKLFEIIAKHSDVVERVTFWNLHDGQSWLNYWPWKRTNHPLLFDRERNPKPAYESVVSMLSKSKAAKADQ